MAKKATKIRISVLGADYSDESYKQKYEIMFILSPMLTEDKRKKLVAEFVEQITTRGGEVFHIEDWGKRNIAYRIKKQDEGYYLVYHFTLTDRKFVKEIDEFLRLEQGILRHIVIKHDEDHVIRDFMNEEEERLARPGAKLTKEQAEAAEAPRPKRVSPKVAKPATSSDSEI
jgi:small subunit ribosomal protein S6